MSNIFALTQRAYRFFNDDGTESTATVAANENTGLTLRVNDGLTRTVLRISLAETGAGSIAGATTDDYQLQVSRNGGAFANVTAASSVVRGFNSANLTDAGITTNNANLSDPGSGLFSGGEVSENGLVSDRQITANNFTEFLYTLEVVTADVAHNDTLDFRVLLNGATTNMTYSVTPRITVDLRRNMVPATANLTLSTTAPSVINTLHENFHDYSEDFSQSYWAKFKSSISADATTAPDGTTTADKLVEDGTSGNHYVGNEGSAEAPGAAGIHTFSIYIKPAERTKVLIELYSDAPTYNDESDIVVDLAIPAVTQTGDNNDTFVSAGVESAANGFFRVWVTSLTPNAVPQLEAFVYLLNATGQASYAGDSSSGFYVWGAQLNRGGKPTYVKTPEAAGTNLSPSRADLVLSTTAPALGVTNNRDLSPAAGNLTLSTVAPSRVTDERRDPSSGDLTLSATAPTVVQTTNVDASPATAQLALSTTVPTVAQTTAVDASPDAARLALTTVAPTVSQDIRRDPASGNLTLSTVAPSAVQDIRRDPASADLTLSSTAPTATVAGSDRSISPAAADMTLSTVAPTVDQTTRVDASPATAQLTLSAEAPSVSAGGNVDLIPETANLTLSTVAPSVVQDVRRDPAQASLTLTTIAPSVTQDIRRDPASGNLAISTVAPSIVEDIRRDPASANLTLSTVAPSIAQDALKQPATANLTLSTVAPSVLQDIRRSPESAQLTITGQAPLVVFGSVSLSPDAASLSLSTKAPAVSVSGQEEDFVGFPAIAPTAIEGSGYGFIERPVGDGEGVIGIGSIGRGRLARVLGEGDAESAPSSSGLVRSVSGAGTADHGTQIHDTVFAIKPLNGKASVAVGISGTGIGHVVIGVNGMAIGEHDDDDEPAMIALLLAA